MYRKKIVTIKYGKILPVLLLLICIALPEICSAQDGPPDPHDVPIDGGLTLLIAAGTAYGIKRYRNHQASGKKEAVEK
jgi:hypothetical protein